MKATLLAFALICSICSPVASPAAAAEWKAFRLDRLVVPVPPGCTLAATSQTAARCEMALPGVTRTIAVRAIDASLGPSDANTLRAKTADARIEFLDRRIRAFDGGLLADPRPLSGKIGQVSVKRDPVPIVQRARPGWAESCIAVRLARRPNRPSTRDPNVDEQAAGCGRFEASFSKASMVVVTVEDRGASVPVALPSDEIGVVAGRILQGLALKD